jgi:hypothetical protein
MFGPGINTVFTSRWKALWWSAGIMLTAYCSVPSAEETAQSKAEQSQDTQAAAQAAHVLEHLSDRQEQD